MALSGDTGWINLQAFSEDDSVGSNTSSWYSIPTGGDGPSNAQLSDDVYAVSGTVTSGIAEAYSHRLLALNPSMPSGIPELALVTGLQVRIEKYASTSSAPRGVWDYELRMVRSGSLTGDNKAATGTAWSTSEAYVEYGGASDDWGLSGLKMGDIDANFGLALRLKYSSSGSSFITNGYVDHIQIRIHWSGAGNMLLVF